MFMLTIFEIYQIKWLEASGDWNSSEVGTAGEC